MPPSIAAGSRKPTDPAMKKTPAAHIQRSWKGDRRYFWGRGFESLFLGAIFKGMRSKKHVGET